MGSNRRWTVAVYLAGGENVSREMILSLHDMRDAALGNRAGLRVLAQFEPDGKTPRIFAFDEGTRSHFTVPGRTRGLAPMPTGLANYEYLLDVDGEEGNGQDSLKLLRDFVETGRSAAGHGPFMVVISGHSNGAVGEFLGYRSGKRPVYLDDLKKALEPLGRSRKKIDLLGLDCCHMGMVEVASEAAPYARLLVASEGFIQNHGWPYRTILEAIPGLTPQEAGAEIVRQYVGSYADYSLLDFPSDCAVSSLERMPILEQSMKVLSRLLTANIHDPDVWRPAVLAHWEAQSYKNEEYVDLADFCDRLRIHVADPEIQAACGDVIASVGEVVRTCAFSGSAFQFSSGLSIYYPWCNDAVKARGDASRGEPSELERYRTLNFSRQTGWAEFLDAYLWATRREARPAPLEWIRNLNHPAVEMTAKRTKEEKEARMMAIKSIPPWKVRGRLGEVELKNHPRSGGARDEADGVRPLRPWTTKGKALPLSRIKNHPRKREE